MHFLTPGVLERNETPMESLGMYSGSWPLPSFVVSLSLWSVVPLYPSLFGRVQVGGRVDGVSMRRIASYASWNRSVLDNGALSGLLHSVVSLVSSAPRANMAVVRSRSAPWQIWLTHPVIVVAIFMSLVLAISKIPLRYVKQRLADYCKWVVLMTNARMSFFPGMCSRHGSTEETSAKVVGIVS